jgi:hypothetical protein
VNEMKGVQAAYNGYIDRYHALPGDETAAVMNARGWAGAAGPAASDGALAMPLANTFNNGGEQTGFWRALRGSGLITGNPNAPATAAGLPVNGANGLLGVASGPAFGMPGPLVCASGLTPKLAAGVDSLIDGPAAANNTGTLRGISNAAAPLVPTGPGAPAVAAYLETAAVLWTVCMSLV